MLRFRLLQKRRKLRVSVRKGIRKNIISHYSSAFTVNPQPRRPSVRSYTVNKLQTWPAETFQKTQISESELISKG